MNSETFVLTGLNDQILLVAETFDRCLEYATKYAKPYFQRIYRKVEGAWEYQFLVFAGRENI